MMWKLITFVIASGLLAFISRASLRKPGVHGFYRFFAWETILLLFLLNIKSWFQNPFVWYQLISWTLLFVSFVPLTLGVQSLRKAGQPTKERSGDSSLLSFEKTTILVTTSIYRYIRHPLYSSLLLLAWGIFFKAPTNLPNSLLVLVSSTFLIATAIADEQECIRFFGDDYQTYMQKTKRFIPFLF